MNGIHFRQSEYQKHWISPCWFQVLQTCLLSQRRPNFQANSVGRLHLSDVFRVGKLWRLQAGYDMVWWHINITIIRNLLNKSHTQYGWNITSQKFPNPLSPPKSVSLGSTWAHGCGSFFMCRARGCCFAHHLGSSTRWVKPNRACYFLRCWGFEHGCRVFFWAVGCYSTFWSKFLEQ